MSLDAGVVRRFHQVLVEEIRDGAPDYLKEPFTVAEIYQSLVPYRTHRDRIGVELNGDYEAALLQLLGGADGLIDLESDAAKSKIRRELDSSNPNTGIYREFAAVQVRLKSEGKTSAKGDDSTAGKGDPTSTIAAAGSGGSPKADAGPSSSKNRSTPSKGKATAALSAPAVRPEVTAKAGSSGRVRGQPPSTCPDCESVLPERETLRFCPFCGTNVFIMPCGDCGEVLERDWAFCIACGTPTDD